MSRWSKRVGRTVAVLAASIAALGASAASAPAGSASAGSVAAVVVGGGPGVLTDPDGNEFPLRSFFVGGVVADGGAAAGRVRFVWRGSFPAVWGDPACDGTCDTIVLDGAVEAGSVGPDGAVTLTGTAREVDLRQGHVVFDSGFDEPFSIVVGGGLGEDAFILQWCLLPEFRIAGSIRAWIVPARRETRARS